MRRLYTFRNGLVSHRPEGHMGTSINNWHHDNDEAVINPVMDSLVHRSKKQQRQRLESDESNRASLYEYKSKNRVAL